LALSTSFLLSFVLGDLLKLDVPNWWDTLRYTNRIKGPDWRIWVLGLRIRAFKLVDNYRVKKTSWKITFMFFEENFVTKQ